MHIENGNFSVGCDMDDCVCMCEDGISGEFGKS